MTAADSCPFPLVPPSCTQTIADHLGRAYSDYVLLYSILTTTVAVPTFASVIWKYNRTRAAPVPSLNRPDHVLIRIALSMIVFVLLTPDPLGYYGVIGVPILELASSFISLILLSVALSFVFRSMRSMLLLSDSGLSHISLITRIYSISQFIAALVWIGIPILQLTLPKQNAHYLKGIPLLLTIMSLATAYGSAAVSSYGIVRRLSNLDVSVSSAVSLQIRLRAGRLMRVIVALASIIWLVFVPVILQETIIVMSSPSYPNMGYIPSRFSTLLLYHAFNIVKILAAAMIAFWSIYMLLSSSRRFPFLERKRNSANAIFTSAIIAHDANNLEAGDRTIIVHSGLDMTGDR